MATRSICVYCSSSDAVEPFYRDLTRELGAAIGRGGDTLVYGGCDIGLMGILAHAVHDNGGRVLSIIPEKLQAKGLGFDRADETIVTTDLRERKALMDEKSDAFVALPGGLGTLEEIVEILSLKYLKFHHNPVVFINARGFYDPLFRFMETMYAAKMAKPGVRDLYHSIERIDELYPLLDAYRPPEVEDKWFKPVPE